MTYIQALKENSKGINTNMTQGPYMQGAPLIILNILNIVTVCDMNSQVRTIYIRTCLG